jgi:D-alanyl-D-alanine carboxypeptidase (penicillin-binding protein 5/6)
MFLNFLLILFLILNPLQLVERERGPRRINHQSLGIKMSAKSAIVLDVETKKILYEKNAHQVLPIASLTKLITADVIVSQKIDWNKVVTIKHQDQAQGAVLFVDAGEKVKVKDLFYSMLVGSANNATKALVRLTGLSQEEFVKQMNQKAQDLGLRNTYFVEPTGLDPKNVSTAYEIALLAKKIFENEKIREATVMEKYIFRTNGEEVRHTVKNTDELLKTFLNQDSYKIIAGKTGYLEEAGYCLVSEVEKDGHRVIGVILGSESNEARFQEMKGLIWWVFENWEW